MCAVKIPESYRRLNCTELYCAELFQSSLMALFFAIAGAQISSLKITENPSIPANQVKCDRRLYSLTCTFWPSSHPIQVSPPQGQ